MPPELALFVFVVPAQDLVDCYVAIAIVVLTYSHALRHQGVDSSADIGPIDLAAMLHVSISACRDLLTVIVILNDVAATHRRPDSPNAGIELVILGRHPIVRMVQTGASGVITRCLVRVHVVLKKDVFMLGDEISGSAHFGH